MAKPGLLCVTTSQPTDAGTLSSWRNVAPGPMCTTRGYEGGFAEFDLSIATEDGLTIVLTPLQMAAVFENETIDESVTLKERLWGGAAVLGGALELVGAGALLLTPEPTAVTKVAGAALGLHGIDTTVAGFRQVVSGEPTTTLTADAAQAAALALGVDEKKRKARRPVC